jgi:diguanylate cyclase (GGDEF)-like protein/PAS domain S-box-containing protein
MFLELINGVALLLALCLLQAFNLRLLQGNKIAEPIVSGFLFGGICIIGMMVPITVAPGAIFDARSVVLAMAGLFGGPWAAIIAASIAGGFRLWLGGVGAEIGIAVVVSSTALGLVYRYCHGKGWVKTGIFQFLIFGFLVHVVAVFLFARFPQGIVQEVMSNIAIPFLLIFTPATAFLGMMLQDIENRVKTEVALHKSELEFRQQTQRLEEVIFGTDAGTWEWNVQTDEAAVNERWGEMLGYTLEELSHFSNGHLQRNDLKVLVHPDCLQRVAEQMERCLSRKSESFECEVQMQHKRGDWMWVLARGRVVELTADGKPLRLSGTHQDITQMKKQQQQLHHIAHYDLLTGLPNRVLLADRMQQAMAQCLRRGETLAVAYLDLDGFKEVNDLHGHDIGDELLIALSQRMKATMREVDTLARIGGDEFVAVLVDLERPQDCEPALARLLRATAEQVTVGDAILQVSASIGVTLYPQDGSDADQLLRHADQAMYLAKQAGKNRYHMFDVDQAAAAEIQRESLEHLRRAMDQREFVLHYQPKVNMKTGELIGAEALIRWQHPERGLLPPSAFLPIIENHTISVEVGDWVINTALTQMTEWLAAGMNIPISVNVGARQLQHAEFAPRLSEFLAAHPAVHPNWLELEILETSALEDIMNVSEIMYACRKIGVRFALDDFGTGYSSLTYLKRLPADVLKIDQTFVRDMLGDADDLAIVEGVMGLANAFRRTVIAEGVETIAHGKLLLSLGCELAQGYAIARPMPAKELPEWAKTWRPDASWVT